jgi:ADP-ribosylglycohydrolase
LAILERCGGDLVPGVLHANTLPKAADSLPAMVGALCGAHQGASAVGAHWRKRLTIIRGVCLPFLVGANLDDLTQQLRARVS